MANKIPRVPVREQDPKVRATNFEEVCYGYDLEEAALEASRCLQCKNPRCVAACPVNIRIPDFIGALHRGELQQAADIIAEDSSLPSICGRVCPQESQCEGSCILGIKGEPVAIGKLERFIGDWKLEHGAAAAQTAPRNGYKVAVIGSGPAGLACASDLAKLGYEVKIFEALHKAGGVLVYGIPEFRLPKAIVQNEVDKLTALGVDLETDMVIGKTFDIDEMFEEGYEAVFIGSGAGLPMFMGIEGETLAGVYSANEYLTRTNLMHAYDFPVYDTPIRQGKNVVVFGGGHVAMDAARTALRLGADSVTLAYRRTEAEMPARLAEVHHAKEEGVHILELVNPLEFIKGEDGFVSAVKLERMELGEPDASGRRRPVPVADSAFEIPCDVAITAIGTMANPFAKLCADVELNRWGLIEADEDGRTSNPKVWAGGDIVTGAATVILAMGAGRTAARAIDEYIRKR